MRNEYCPICGGETEPIIRIRFNNKMGLPKHPRFRHCTTDNFLFLADGSQALYSEYYASFSSDSCHQEVSIGDSRSPIAKLQCDHLLLAVNEFFSSPRKVLDFGCGEACLLVELAINFPSSRFVGYDPGPAVHIGLTKVRVLGLENLSFTDVRPSIESGPFDLIIASHVVEHLVDFESLRLLNSLMSEHGLLYLEVPDSLSYDTHERREFLYYFDRLHVNHFTPQSLSRLLITYGFSRIKEFQYSFPYRDGGRYPAFGMLFRKENEREGKGREGKARSITSPSLLEAVNSYIGHEKARAKGIVAQLNAFKAVLVWGTGDNFFRSLDNCGPLASLRNLVLLDRRQNEVTIGRHKYLTMQPEIGIRRHDWPVVVTVSEGRDTIRQQIFEIDPDRPVFLL